MKKFVKFEFSIYVSDYGPVYEEAKLPNVDEIYVLHQYCYANTAGLYFLK